MVELQDGRYGYEYESKKAVFELYTVDGQLFYDYSLNGRLLVKQGSAQEGEDKARLLERLQHIVRNSGPAI